MANEKNVYCKHCKWFDSNFPFSFLFTGCFGYKIKKIEYNAMGITEKTRDYFGKSRYPHNRSNELNENNNCKYYKRSWWRIWIKK